MAPRSKKSGERLRVCASDRRGSGVRTTISAAAIAAATWVGAWRYRGAGKGCAGPDRHECTVGLDHGYVEGAALLIPIPSGGRVWIATGHTDMRRGMLGLALQVQEGLSRDPHGGDLFIFRGRRGDLAKILWHDGIGLSLYAKRLDRGKFIWPSASDGAVSISPAQMAYMLEGIDWRNPQLTWRPKSAG
jgi:transposase